MDKTFAHAPAVVLTAAGIGLLLHVDLFPRVLPDITDQHRSRDTVEAVPKGIAQAEGPNFLLVGYRSEKRVIWRNGVGARRVFNMNAQHFSE